MKKILVTGAAGFLGAHLCERLQNLGYKVVGKQEVVKPKTIEKEKDNKEKKWR